jgi:hypothetical protein
MDCMDQNPDGREPKVNVFARFCDYCRNNKLPTITSDTFWKRFPEFVRFEISRETVEGKRPMCLRGWRIRPVEEWGKYDDADEDKMGKTLDTPDSPDSVNSVKPVKGLDYFSQGVGNGG